jgi:hypothetical protein
MTQMPAQECVKDKLDKFKATDYTDCTNFYLK